MKKCNFAKWFNSIFKNIFYYLNEDEAIFEKDVFKVRISTISDIKEKAGRVKLTYAKIEN
jgi:hypothetical protein